MSTRAALVFALGLCACKEPTGSNTGGLAIVSETAPTEFGDPPECAGTTGDAATSTAAAEDVPEDTSLASQAFCAGLTSAPACDGVARDGGVCRWLDVVPVYPGTCEVTELYRACVFVPPVSECEAPTSCDQIGLGVYGRRGCDDAVELVIVSPSDGLCGAPAGWTLCDGDDPPAECSCACS